ncbi:hypothetical protein M5K25_019103 [Dendrobium thyrsiflorum]|uniref:Uncharacterized protein n=1 Tax=Dendrobium thyrsiflorum TaxID=117978 RepID=A0ABD0UE65_DENTH
MENIMVADTMPWSSSIGIVSEEWCSENKQQQQQLHFPALLDIQHPSVSSPRHSSNQAIAAADNGVVNDLRASLLQLNEEKKFHLYTGPHGTGSGANRGRTLRLLYARSDAQAMPSRVGRGEISFRGRNPCLFMEKKSDFFMAAKKVDALEERLEGEMSQIKATKEDRISSVEHKISDLHAMMKLLENQIQTAPSEVKEPAGKTTNSDCRRRDDEVETMEEQGGGMEEDKLLKTSLTFTAELKAKVRVNTVNLELIKEET